MAISFDQVPANIRIPFVTAEFDASRASQGPGLLSYAGILIGQRTSAGTAAANTLHRVTNAEAVATLAGRGSQLHRQAIGWFASNTSTELWIGVLDDDGGAVAATGTITVTGPATADGTIVLYLGGVRLTVGVTDGDTDATIATAIAAEVNANGDLPVTASPAAAVVTLTQRNAGLSGNDYDVRHSFNDGEALPAGVGLAIVAMSGGATNPTLTSLIAAMGDQWFQIWSHPYTDATSLTAIENELSSRFGPMRQIDGVAITSAVGSHATLTTLGNTRNSQHSSIIAQPGANPLTPPMEFAAEAAAIIAFYGAIDPARPFQTLAMTNAILPAEGDLFTDDERNMLLFDGIATTRAGVNQVQIERPITTYQTNAIGAPDTAYLDVNTLLTLLYLRYSWRVRIQTRYPRHKLASDGARIGPGQAVMTPKLGRAEAVSWFRDMEDLGLVENFDDFKANLVVERNQQDVNRLDVLLPPDLINQLIVTAAKIQFRL